MSRVGKHPIPVPSDVTVDLKNDVLSARGKLGSLVLPLSEEVQVTLEEGALTVRPMNETAVSRAMWGTTRNLVRNLIEGVSKGFSVNLEITGVGYRAAVQGDELVLQLGFSHDVKVPLPSGISVKCEKPTTIQVTGADRRQVGEFAAQIRSFRPPEPYKGKGIKYVDEVIYRKEGKKK